MEIAQELSFASTRIEDLAVQHEVDVDSLTGSALVGVPLPLTSGRSDFGPALTLQYSSSARNSAFGVGWYLAGLPAISIDTRRSLPKYDGRDRYAFGGDDELVPVLRQQRRGSPWRVRTTERTEFWVQHFRSKVERSYVRFERWVHKSTGRIHWRSRDGENVVTVYGFDPSGGSRISDPDSPGRTYLWLPEAKYDPSGNAIRYVYEPENGQGISLGLSYERSRLIKAKGFAQRYIKRIQYGNTKPLQEGSPEPGDNRWLFEAVFDYGDHTDPPSPAPNQQWPVREDPFSDYRSGFETRTYRLCRRVLMFHRFDELGPGATLVGVTRLEHEEDPAGSTLRVYHFTGHRREQGGQVTQRSLPPVEFTYTTPSVAEAFQAAPEETEENVPHGITGLRYRWVDLYGEGLPGILTETDQAWYYKPNEGGGRFGPQQRVAEKPSQRSDGYALGDFDGDGNTNLVVLQGRQAGFYELDRDTNRWGGFRSFDSLPHLEAYGAEAQLLDLSGDGRSDLILSERDRFSWYPSLGKEGFGAAVEMPKPQTAGTLQPQQIEEDPELHFFFADMNGDGLMDQVRIQNGRVEYWPQIGNGRFGDAVLMEGSPTFAGDSEFDDSRLRLVDLDGSGTTDIVYIGCGEVRYWTNASGNRLGEEHRITNLPFIDNLSTVRVLDFLGDGTSCLVWSSPLLGHANPIHYLQLTNGVNPRLLLSVDNSMGRETKLTYSFSASHYLRDKESGRGWSSKLPTHTTVVDEREVIDHIGGSRNVSRYEYRDGCFDGEEQTFRGFGLVDQYDAEVHGESPADPGLSYIAPACVRTWFHPGSPTRHHLPPDRYELDGEQPGVSPHVFEDLSALQPAEYDDGLRALAGQVIRQEVFAVDEEGQRADHPYQVTQSSFRLRRLQPAEHGYDACFASYLGERVTHDYEQEPDDPRVCHHLVLDVDDYGNVLLECAAAYARRPSRPSASASQRRHSVSVYRHRYLNQNGPDRYEVGIPVESQEFELSGLSPDAPRLFRAEGLKTTLAPALANPLDHHEDFAPGGVQARLVDWDRSYYWDDAGTANLPLGRIGARTLLHHEESACFTPELIKDVFANRVSASSLRSDGGYTQRSGYWWRRDPVHHYVPDGGFFLLARIERWDGASASYGHDPYFLTPVEVADDLGNRTKAEIDYHAVAPKAITDPNDNRAEVLYDPLGVVVVSTMRGSVRGSAGGAQPYGNEPLANYVPRPNPDLAAALANPGRYLQKAGQFVCYDLDAWTGSRSPPRSLTLIREEFVHDGQGGGTAAGRIQVAVAYLDGFGRTLQNKLLVEPGPAIQRDANGRVVLDISGVPVEAQAPTRWLASGHIVYDEKLQPVRQYEPYYSPTEAFESDEELSRFGVSRQFQYDALGRQIREDLPNGTYSKVEYVPWEVRHHDPNDTVLDSLYRLLREGLPDTNVEKQALRKAEAHGNTPTVVHLDPQGQEVRQVETGTSGTQRVTESILDPWGNVTEVVDPRGLTAFHYRYDMQGRVLYTESVDAGKSWTLPDAADRPVHQWDGRDVHQRRQFDTLDRPTSVRADGALGLNQLVEEMIYGEDPSVGQRLRRNARGRLVTLRDSAGVLTISQYDPLGNVLSSERRLRQDYKSEPDWTNPSNVLLEPSRFVSEATYDALGRVRRQVLPDNTVRQTAYLRGGGVEQVWLGSTDRTLPNGLLLNGSSFNARGQRTRAVLGNGVEIDYLYDAETFLTKRITARRQATGITGTACTLQDIEYTYDPMGNITRAVDYAQQPAGQRVPNVNPCPMIQGINVSSHQDFTYDAFYQLEEATGRVHQALIQHDYRPDLPHAGGLKGTRHLSLNNGQAVERYTRTYKYDLSGNVEHIRHVGATRGWTTGVWTSLASNRSLPTTDAAGNLVTNQESRFDASGNCEYLPHLQSLVWNYRNGLARAVVINRPVGQPDDAEYYVYDSDGVRVRKVFEKLVAGQLEITEKIYLDGCEIKRIRRGGQSLLERTTSHVTDGVNRLALVHRWTRDRQRRETDDTSRPKTHYQLTNHLGSSILELDERGGLISYEEYFPYGGTAFMAGDQIRDINLKEYRYSGKERDDATGLYYFGYRYYAPWIGKWLSPDPLDSEDSLNLYQFVLNNPVNRLDPDGLQSTAASTGRDPRILFIRFAQLPPHLKTKENYESGYRLLRDPTSGRFVEVESEQQLYARAQEIGGVIEVYDPKLQKLLEEALRSPTEKKIQALREYAETTFSTIQEQLATSSSATEVAQEKTLTEEEEDVASRTVEAEPDDTSSARSGVHSAEGDSTVQTPPANPGGSGVSKQRRTATDGGKGQTGTGAGNAGSGPGAGSTGVGRGSKGAQGIGGDGTAIVEASPPPAPGIGPGTSQTEPGVSGIAPSPGVQLIPNQMWNGEDPNGSLYGSPLGTRSGPEGSGTANRGSPTGQQGSVGGAREGQRGTAWDVTTGAVGRLLNWELGGDSERGESGGLPGGTGSYNFGVAGQILYVALSIITSIGPIAKRIGSFTGALIRRAGRFVTALFSQAKQAIGGRLLLALSQLARSNVLPRLQAWWDKFRKVLGFSTAKEPSAIVHMANELMETLAFRWGLRLEPEVISGFRILGNKGLVGSVFVRNIFEIEAEKKGAVSLRALLNTLEAEAKAAGATRLDITGIAIRNESFLNPAILRRFGFEFQRVSEKVIYLTKALSL